MRIWIETIVIYCKELSMLYFIGWKNTHTINMLRF